MLWGTLQIFGYKSLGEGDEQTGGFFGGNMGNVEMSCTDIGRHISLTIKNVFI